MTIDGIPSKSGPRVFSPGGVCPICGEKDGKPHGEPCLSTWTVPHVPKAMVQERPPEGTVHPFYDWTDDPFRCRNCGHTILPGETHIFQGKDCGVVKP